MGSNLQATRATATRENLRIVAFLVAMMHLTRQAFLAKRHVRQEDIT